jgi:hypothetical protein
MDTDVLRSIEELRERRHNLRDRDIERVAREAGWEYDRTTRHIIYVKEGFWANLSIPRGKVKGSTALRLLSLIEASVYEEEASSE